jgi:hypothetical protein
VADPKLIAEMLARAEAKVKRLKAKGWKRKDFANALRKLFGHGKG